MLTAEELENLFAPLLTDVRARLRSLSGDDPSLLFALRRKLYKELSYDERGKPMQRKVLKAVKYTEQGGRCKICGDELEKLGRNAVLDRTEAIRGYVSDNVRLICAACDRKVQAERGFA
jgi:ribosomal protein L44E